MTVLLLCQPALAQQAAFGTGEIRALNNLQNELLTCANYFLLVQRCVMNTPTTPPETVVGYSRAADALIQRGWMVGKMIEMTEDAMQSRMKAEGAAMMTLVNGNCVNIASAMTRYSERCLTVSNEGDKVLADYLSKEQPD
ncbi:MAG: hypothetical protein K2Y42_06745 [Hyphomicrobium sp.]|uniref:hypothetical protein n=1 Tax=Hyphomicrobium sp. TaxID=82 RepID=UPI0025BEEF34|nr:hypothetical protein [Hyphomicrobium sp.]MBX9862435.1 hypothetical protein [Hyphomicrobium sp.]